MRWIFGKITIYNISKQSLNYFIYPSTCKKANVIPIHKRDDIQYVNNYCHMLPLPVFGKFFEKLINEIYNLDREKLLNTNQSGFGPSDSWVNQFLILTYEIFSSFDCNPSLEVQSKFLDISKAFDKVWHEGLLYKLKFFGISRNLCNLIKHWPFLSDRFQRILLNGHCSNWLPVLAGVPQESILGHFF